MEKENQQVDCDLKNTYFNLQLMENLDGHIKTMGINAVEKIKQESK